jgi:hypothetical protein
MATGPHGDLLVNGRQPIRQGPYLPFSATRQRAPILCPEIFGQGEAFLHPVIAMKLVHLYDRLVAVTRHFDCRSRRHAQHCPLLAVHHEEAFEDHAQGAQNLLKGFLDMSQSNLRGIQDMMSDLLPDGFSKVVERPGTRDDDANTLARRDHSHLSIEDVFHVLAIRSPRK